MSDLRIIVDHLKLEYSGLMDVREFFKIIGSFCKERDYQKKEDKNHEHNKSDGKYIEYEISPWKKVSDYHRYIIKIRLLFQHLNKVEIVKDKKKVQIDKGKVIIYLDGYMENDYLNRWDDRPFLLFIRTIYDKFIYKLYTERFEQILAHEVQDLYTEIEKFLNMSGSYKVISKTPRY
ncbi:MAG: hypothetical protein KKC75_06020 [Nanoarchaeota archaeon]|nr:hypothetical protein [Nanoarchaeota archaeon]MBU1004702.1 hypothetical protein [Nanoarchaeota archaeon]MBU1945748.1 hypothetical protein [Nanoarchaeota archaeon]